MSTDGRVASQHNHWRPGEDRLREKFLRYAVRQSERPVSGPELLAIFPRVGDTGKGVMALAVHADARYMVTAVIKTKK